MMKRIAAVVALVWASVSFGSGEWKQIGKSGDWGKTRGGAVIGTTLYTIESGGHLYATELPSGAWKKIGGADYANTKFMIAGTDALYTIETSGTLYKINPKDGTWGTLGKPGEWSKTIAATIHQSKLYTVESSGVFYVTDLATGGWKKLGKPEFANTVVIVSAGDSLFTVERSGSLYKINPATAAWKSIGKPGDWKDTIALTTLNGKLFTVETNGGLYVTDPNTGAWKPVGQPEFGNTAFLWGAGNMLYSVEASGTLYGINP